MDFDFHPPHSTSINRRKKKSRLIPGILLLIGLITLSSFLLLRTGHETEEPTIAAATPEIAPQPQIRQDVVKGTIASGDTATSLLGRYFTAAEIHELNQQCKPVFPLTRLSAGQPYRLILLDDQFERFEYDIDREEQLIISRSADPADSFSVERIDIPYTIETARVNGTIETSLFEAVTGSGESDVLAMNLADIFAWDIDFILDIRQGDSFQVLVEKRFRENQAAGYGRILAAEFTNQGDSFLAFLYKDGDKRPDYYDAEGNSLRKAFLKAPLSFTRISSGFTMRRFHPIAKTWRAHPAIDYAAPRGTPIKSVGDGVIVKKGYTRGNGNYVKIRHNSTYETLYLHMKGFARKIAKGKRVVQGQTIGYVGSTGLATGPHLCFRMYKNGSPVNPHRVKAPSAQPIAKANRADFKTRVDELLANLTVPATINTASINPSANNRQTN